MSNRVFIDTNILIYYFLKDKEKFSITENLLTDSTLQIVTSTQVLSELISVILKKKLNDIESARYYLKYAKSAFEVVSFDENDLDTALRIKERYKLSYYDSLIVANALKSNCSILYTEDLHHSLKIDKTLKVINPFK